MGHKTIIQIETYSPDEFFERLAGLIERSNSTLSQTKEPLEEVSIMLGSDCWQTSRVAMKHFKVSAPTLKAMRDRGDVKYMKIGRGYRYDMCG
jgi:hypothetical protein